MSKVLKKLAVVTAIIIVIIVISNLIYNLLEKFTDKALLISIPLSLLIIYFLFTQTPIKKLLNKNYLLEK